MKQKTKGQSDKKIKKKEEKSTHKCKNEGGFP